MPGSQKTIRIQMTGYTTKERIITPMTKKETYIFIGAAFGLAGTMIACSQYNVVKERQLREKKVENEKLYYAKLTPEQVEAIEKKKLEIKNNEIELKKTEAELKKTVDQFKNDIQAAVEEKIMTLIHDDIRDTFDNWAEKYENKIDRVVSRIDDLSDKYGGVKGNNSAPSINVVNAPNN